MQYRVRMGYRANELSVSARCRARWVSARLVRDTVARLLTHPRGTLPGSISVTVELRQQFGHDALRRVVPVTELCAAYGISRKTGYKFLARYEASGAAGLADQSRRPHRPPAALEPVLLQRLLEAHHRHPYWGPRKLLCLVGQRWPEAPWPVRSTVARCFQHLGLVTARRRVRRPGPAGPPTAPMETPNAVWTTDYKGQFKLGDGQYCFPLTVADGYSRLLLACQALTAPSWSRPGPSSSASSASTASRSASAPTTASPSPLRRSAACPPSRSGGSASVLCPISPSPARPTRMGVTSACTSR